MTNLLLPAAGAIAIGLLMSDSAAARSLRLEPIDQADRDPEFAAWRAELLEAVRRRDVDYVVSMADPEIKLSFGGDYGRDSFRTMLAGDDAGQGEPYWAELQVVIELGGVFMEDGAFCTPYLSCVDVPGCSECDPYDTVYVMGPEVLARAKPETTAPIVATLSWDVLSVDYDAKSPAGWVPVKLEDQRTVYLPESEARMAIDYRARFEKTAEGWRMKVFIAGD